MYTEYLGPIDRNHLQEATPILERAARFAQQGEPISFPTETVYGLGANILNEKAIKRVFEIKKRNLNHALPIQIAHLEQVPFIAREIPSLFHEFARLFLPGPLTIVLKKNPHILSLICGGKDSVAIRVSSDPIANRIIELTGCPLAVSSANLSGKPSPISAKHVLEDFNGLITCIVDGGEAEYGLESTVLSLEDPTTPTLLRFGMISKSQLEKVAPIQVHPSAYFTSNSFSHSNAAIRLFSSWEEIKIYLQLSVDCKRLIMSHGEKSPLFKECDHFQLNERNLYQGLRFAQQDRYTEILVLCDSPLLKHEVLLSRLKQLAFV